MTMKWYRPRWRQPGLVLFSVLFVIAYFSVFRIPRNTCSHSEYHRGHFPNSFPRDFSLPLEFRSQRHLLDHHDPNSTNETSAPSQAQFPDDIFTDEQKKKGAVVLHVFGLVYMFVALAIVCDEFFVPSLDVITVKLDISEDVAGATFMAAGGSAPELFTSVIGVFISYDDVGIGTIVGSAVFNILFVISMCAIFSKTVLSLTWWPLFRDVSFYSVSLIALIVCFKDSIIHWYEATILLGCYAAYVTFMKFNECTEKAVRKLLNRSKFTRVGSKDHLVPSMKKRRASTPILHAGSKFRHGLLQLMIHSIDPLHDGKLDEKASQLHAIASLRVLLDAAKANGGYPTGHNSTTTGGGGCCSACATCPACVTCPTCNRPLVRPLMPSDPMTAAGNLASYIVTSSSSPPPDNPSSVPVASTLPEINGTRQVVPHGHDPLTNFQNLQSSSLVNSLANGTVSELPESITLKENTPDVSTSPKVQNTTRNDPSNIDPSSAPISTIMTDAITPAVSVIQPGSSTGSHLLSDQPNSIVEGGAAILQQKAEPEIEVDEPLDISWPNTFRKRVTYILMAPIIFPLWLTLPDVRRDEKKKWFFVTFLGSIMWIALFSYLMVWWASVVGSTIGIPNEIMGLTFLAAGTSIPDLITSVLVARKGFGDMAVSSSIGSNIFDVTVGLPLPWLLSSLIFGPVHVSSTGMACSIVILFLMLLFVIISIAAFKWKMNLGLAIVMFILYFAFVAVSLLLEYEVINCTYLMSFVTG